MAPKRLYRSQENRVLFGICGGLGAYLDVDPVVIRLLWVLGTVLTWFIPGIIAYLVLFFIIPEHTTSPKGRRKQ